VWFGRPYDNWHRLVGCDAEHDLLRVHFNEGETLSVWSPQVLTVDASTFRIGGADRVRWEWFLYGRPKTPSNLFFQDFIRQATAVSATTNVDWYTPELNPSSSDAAVEIL
jgi:hypothetical protein